MNKFEWVVGEDAYIPTRAMKYLKDGETWGSIRYWYGNVGPNGQNIGVWYAYPTWWGKEYRCKTKEAAMFLVELQVGE